MSMFLILLAAGDSKRLKSNIPKPFITINNKTLLEYSLDSFKKFNSIKKIFVVYNKKHKKYLNKLKLKNTTKIIGGKNRQESTFKALKVIKKMKCKKVLIHDAARPCPSSKLIEKLINKLKNTQAVVPVVKITDATKRVKNKTIFKNISRDSLRFSQTPQGFTFSKLYKAHKDNFSESFDDDSALFTKSNNKVSTIEGSRTNIKITNKEDVKIFSALKNRKNFYGIGFDIHRLVKGRKLYLGGIKIPFHLGLQGHSDSDPVLHALIDSMLGACKFGDIGKLFSNKNIKYKNIRSTLLLKKVINLIYSKNYHINNIDINIITEKPKISKYSNKMIKTISKICKINPKIISIKGKTTEKLGLIGKGKAIASEAIVSIASYD